MSIAEEVTVPTRTSIVTALLKHINSYFKGASGTVGWIGVICIGKPVQNDQMWK